MVCHEHSCGNLEGACCEHDSTWLVLVILTEQSSGERGDEEQDGEIRTKKAEAEGRVAVMQRPGDLGGTLQHSWKPSHFHFGERNMERDGADFESSHQWSLWQRPSHVASFLQGDRAGHRT